MNISDASLKKLAEERALQIVPVIHVNGLDGEPEERKIIRNKVASEIEGLRTQLKRGLEYEFSLLRNNDTMRKLFETLRQSAICALHPCPTLSMIVRLCDEGRKVGLDPARFEAHAPSQPEGRS